MGSPHDEDRWGPEISDLVVAYHPESLARRPVRRDEVVETLRARGRRRAARIAAALPHAGGLFDPDGIDRVLLEAHLELQRLHEEFANGWRVRTTGLGLAVWTRPRLEVIVLASFVAAAVLSLEPALRALRRKQVDRLHEEIRKDGVE